MNTKKQSYHHGDLAESLLRAVDELATQFGLEAVTLRACAKRVGVSPSSAFRHYADKRALLTAFATRAIHRLADALVSAQERAGREGGDAFIAVALAYIEFAVDKPALFRAMWREETIYASDPHYIEASRRLSAHLQGGFAGTIHDKDPDSLSPQELLAWSAVHGLASLLVDGPVGRGRERAQQLQQAHAAVLALRPLFEWPPSAAHNGRGGLYSE